MSTLNDLTAVELAAAIRAKTVSPVEAVRAALDRIEARSDLNAFITVTAEAALEAAEEAERAVMSGEYLPALHGVPYSVKDLLDTRGVRTTMGSYIFADNVPAEDAVTVARARKAGAILIGKTTTPEFGHYQSPTAPIFGRTYSPIDRTVTPGASSSGAAVAVAAGMGPLALGTDGGGSIRIPASCCGIVGMKPTLGETPHLQLPDLFGANSFVGPMARNVADAALLFEAIAGPDRRDPYGQGGAPAARDAPKDLEGLRVGWLPRGGARLEREVAAITTKAVKLFEGEGAVVEEIELDLKALEPVFLTMLRVGLAARVGRFTDQFGDRMSPSLVETIRLGKGYSGVELANASYARTTLFRQFQELLLRFDVIVSPTLTAPPLPIDVDPMGELVIDGEPAGTVRGAWYPFTYPQNMTGHPAISIPCGTTSSGLPVGLQLCAEWLRDRYMLAVAAMMETVLPRR